jgi:anti-sigma regulatory factor (Ser/Thr protein kinase)
MLTPGETFSATYEAVPEAVKTARHALIDFARQAGAQRERLQAVSLASSEAITNVVIHAYEQTETGEVQVNASYIEDELWVLVADSGHGLRPRVNSPGLGLGLALIAQLADEFQIVGRGSGGTEVRMRFDLCAARSRRARADGSERRTNRSGPGGSTSADRQLITG